MLNKLQALKLLLISLEQNPPKKLSLDTSKSNDKSVGSEFNIPGYRNLTAPIEEKYLEAK
jgi:hypothetical protein